MEDCKKMPAAKATMPVYDYNGNDSLSEIFSVIIEVGLQIEFFNEFSFTWRERIAGRVQGADGL